MNVPEILRQPEGKTLEFKRDLSSPRPILRTLVAFANSAGGRLLIGVEDASRRLIGITEPLALEERIADLVADSIEPRLLVDIDILPWRRSNLVLNAVVHADYAQRGAPIRIGDGRDRGSDPRVPRHSKRPLHGRTRGTYRKDDAHHAAATQASR